jgi:hypothetical protein
MYKYSTGDIVEHREPKALSLAQCFFYDHMRKQKKTEDREEKSK